MNSNPPIVGYDDDGKPIFPKRPGSKIGLGVGCLIALSPVGHVIGAIALGLYAAFLALVFSPAILVWQLSSHQAVIPTILLLSVGLYFLWRGHRWAWRRIRTNTRRQTVATHAYMAMYTPEKVEFRERRPGWRDTLAFHAGTPQPPPTP